jgi:two-component system phosphate regulon response regulator PhoB
MNDGEKASFQIYGIDFDPALGEVSIEGESIPLTKTEFGVLHLLARNAGTAFTRQQIIEAVKGADYPVTDRAVDVQISNLRKKLGARGKLIETIRGVGFRLRPSSTL